MHMHMSRTRRLVVLLTDKESGVLLREAKALGVSMAEVARMALSDLLTAWPARTSIFVRRVTRAKP